MNNAIGYMIEMQGNMAGVGWFRVTDMIEGLAKAERELAYWQHRNPKAAFRIVEVEVEA